MNDSNVLESLTDGFYEVDRDGRFTAVNGALCRLLDRPRDAVIGRRVGDLAADAPADGFGDATGGRFIWRVGSNGSSRVLEASAVPVHDEQGGLIGFRGIVRDVTDRERVAAELERARAAALEQTRAKSEFVAHVSHDLRTPMNGIIGMTDLALDTELTDEQREFLTAVRSSAQSLLTLVNDILDFSKIEAGKLELERIPFSLRDCVSDALRPLSLAAHAKGLELLTEVDPVAPDSIVGDPTRLRQVLVNLTDNAIKFTRQGHVLVRVEVERLDGTDAVLRFRVADTGVGIPVAETEAIFAPFVQTGATADRRRGTGLGLAISRKLVGLMGGRIGVESEPGRGSVFCFTSHVSIGPGVSRHALARHADLKGLRVLVADANAASRQILAEGLRYFGLRVDAVATGEAALTALLHQRPGAEPYRVAAIDMLLPDVDGFGVATRIRNETGESTRLILLTRSGQRGDAARCRDLGIAGYLSKPVNPLDLLDAIRAVLGHSDGAQRPALVTRHSLREAKPKLDILVAEDDPVNQLVIRTLLEKSGHGATIVASGSEAVEAVERQAFDAVLMDINMPGLDGIAATSVLREREAQIGGRRLPIVALTAHALEGDEQRLLDAGMDAYLAKPFEPGDLFAVLERIAPRDRARAPMPEPSRAMGETVVDREKLLEQTGGDVDLLRQVVEVFLEEKASMLAAARGAVERGDAAEIARTAHRIKGTCVTLAARLAGEAAAQLERVGRAGDLRHVRGLLELLEERVRQVEAELVALVRPWGQRRTAST
jgi:PAS domain S-box-containing protein